MRSGVSKSLTRSARGHVIAHDRLPVRRQAIEHQMERLAAVLHHRLQQVDEQFGVERAVVGAEPARAIGIDRRSGTERLSLPGSMHHRRLTPYAPGLAMH